MSNQTPILIASDLPPASQTRILYVLVGAGGTGARILPPLTQIMRRGDVAVVYDHDIVEERNLIRQHFHASDIGEYKAVIMASRYSRPHTPVKAFATRFTPAHASQLYAEITSNGRLGGDAEVFQHGIPTAMVLIGAVDNPAARIDLHHFASTFRTNWPIAYVDVGNEMRGGQALLSLYKWPFRRVGGASGATEVRTWITADTIRQAMPQLLVSASGADQQACGERIDLQTVQVNMMAATCAINLIAQLVTGVPFANLGVFFSTLNSMQGIPLASLRPPAAGSPPVHIGTPSTEFAQS